MSTNLEQAYSLSSVDPIFKIKFGKYYTNAFNTSTPLWNKIDKLDNFTGKKIEFPVPTTYKGGVGSGVLPESKPASYGDVQMFSKKVYATDKVDREAVMASLGDEGAFVRTMAETIKKTVEADLWNWNRILFGNGDGSIGTVNSVVDNGGGNYSVVIGASATAFKAANFEENMFINFASGTDLFEVQSVTESTRTIVVQRQAGGTNIPTASDIAYMQGSKDNDPFGLKQVLDATVGTLYNVTVGRKWQAYQEAATSGITTDLMNKVMVRIEKKVGRPADIIVTSYEQYEKILNLMEDDKRYSMYSTKPRGYENVKGVLSFSGVEFMSTAGAVPIFPDKFVEPDRMYFLNSEHIKLMRRPGAGWVKDDIGGSGYLRVAGEDQLEARLATYGNIFIAPTFHGVISGLTV